MRPLVLHLLSYENTLYGVFAFLGVFYLLLTFSQEFWNTLHIIRLEKLQCNQAVSIINYIANKYLFLVKYAHFISFSFFFLFASTNGSFFFVAFINYSFFKFLFLISFFFFLRVQMTAFYFRDFIIYLFSKFVDYFYLNERLYISFKYI